MKVPLTLVLTLELTDTLPKADFKPAVHIDLKNESNVLVLYTGGTIGMVQNSVGALVPKVSLNKIFNMLSTQVFYSVKHWKQVLDRMLQCMISPTQR